MQATAIHARVNGGFDPPSSRDVMEWPEFTALAKRLGIVLDVPFRDLKIEFCHGSLVQITQVYVADNIDQPNALTAFDVRRMERESKSIEL